MNYVIIYLLLMSMAVRIMERCVKEYPKLPAKDLAWITLFAFFWPATLPLFLFLSWFENGFYMSKEPPQT